MAEKKLTVITPDGREYVTGEREALRLIRTAGYRPKKAAAPAAKADKPESNK